MLFDLLLASGLWKLFILYYCAYRTLNWGAGSVLNEKCVIFKSCHLLSNIFSFTLKWIYQLVYTRPEKYTKLFRVLPGGHKFWSVRRLVESNFSLFHSSKKKNGHIFCSINLEWARFDNIVDGITFTKSTADAWLVHHGKMVGNRRGRQKGPTELISHGPQKWKSYAGKIGWMDSEIGW